ncbi:neuropeptide CCHamide-1 receptor-like isoform X2 [Phlebotomus argentipes]|uniref:neuropeptide CCHamide-1 receptor-like isoform X2 n=1 Tax=Phlebotomus argentipes TaxID=94469 RepID=UPI002893305E|nr:neuropeptide CCHamide-1 receptor-like isoform X2 [Phlebotomus argentipes]
MLESGTDIPRTDIFSAVANFSADDPLFVDLNGTGFENTTQVAYTPYENRPETYIVPVIFFLIFVVGVIGNGTLVVVFLRHRAMRNVPNTYILSLALADLLVILTTVPLTSTVYVFDSWFWGQELCTISEFVKDVSIGVSVFTLTALSGDRFFAIVDPLRKFHTHSGRATKLTISIAISIWILAIICGIPALVGSYIRVVEVNKDVSFELCYPFGPPEWGKSYARYMVIARFLIFYAIPLLIIAIFYALIARHLFYSASNVPGEMQGAMRQIKARRKVAITVLAFVVIFGLCFLPSHLFMIWFYYCPTAEEDYNVYWHVLRIVGFCLSFANSCANPVALYCVSGAFRKHFTRYLLCRFRSNSRRKRDGCVVTHRDTSMTSTVSRRYTSRRQCNHQSTMRSKVLETSVTILPNGAGNNKNGTD